MHFDDVGRAETPLTKGSNPACCVIGLFRVLSTFHVDDNDDKTADAEDDAGNRQPAEAAWLLGRARICAARHASTRAQRRFVRRAGLLGKGIIGRLVNRGIARRDRLPSWLHRTGRTVCSTVEVVTAVNIARIVARVGCRAIRIITGRSIAVVSRGRIRKRGTRLELE